MSKSEILPSCLMREKKMDFICGIAGVTTGKRLTSASPTCRTAGQKAAAV